MDLFTWFWKTKATINNMSRSGRPTDWLFSKKTDSECQQNCLVFFQCLAPHWSTFFAKSCFSYRHWVPFLVRTCAPLLSFKYQNFATPWSQSSWGPKFGSIFKNLKNACTHFTWLLENKDGGRGFCWIVELICRDLLNLKKPDKIQYRPIDLFFRDL